MAKLEWIPLYIDRLLSSPKVQKMRDYQRAWYIWLLLHCTRSEKPGYLRLDGRLWMLAGAHSRSFFESQKAAVMAAFKVAHIDGQDWIYNDRLLNVVMTQHDKLSKGLRRKSDKNAVSLSSSIAEVSTELEVQKHKPSLENVYNAYPRKVGKRAALKAISQAFTRLIAGKEAPSEIFQTVADAEVYLVLRCNMFAQSPAGQAGKFTPHPATWFNASRYLDDESEWYKHGTEQVSKTQQRLRNNISAIVEGLSGQHVEFSGDSVSEGADQRRGTGLGELVAGKASGAN